MEIYCIKLYRELRRWRDEEISLGNMAKAKKIQSIIKKKRNYYSSILQKY